MQTNAEKGKTRKRTKQGNIKTSYGIVKLPKGTRLYHASANMLCTLPQKPVVFMTLHPSEWYMEDSYISVIELQREVSLLFMVNQIRKMRIYSSLNKYLGNENTNLAKMNYERIKCWLPFLQKEDLDGWFSSIENKTTIEFVILNNPSILKIVECLPIHFDWANSKYSNTMNLIPKKWGKTYTISTDINPIRMILNHRFQSQIEEYKKQVADEDPDGTAFSILLKNAIITYIDAPLENIIWC
jgi:hypothetical protein